MAAFEDLARRLRATWGDAKRQRPWRSYADLVNRDLESDPTSYKLTQEQRQFVTEAMAQLIELIDIWAKGEQSFDRGKETKEGRSPRPKPVLRMMPPGSNDPRNERAAADVTIPPAAG